MIREKAPEKSEDGVTQNSEGLKRRDLLLSGTSLVAASALLGAGLASPAQAQQLAATPPFTDGFNEAYAAPAQPRPLYGQLQEALELGAAQADRAPWRQVLGRL